MAIGRLTAWVGFFKQVRSEAKKVVWPQRQDVVLTTIFVFIMVTLFALFFIGVDSILATAVGWLLR